MFQRRPFGCQLDQECLLFLADILGLLDVGVIFCDQLLFLVLFGFQVAFARLGIRIQLFHFRVILLQLLLLLHDQFLVPFMFIQ
ncbi:hypothetical protein D3C76_1326230 [compost metagenome]